MIINYLNNILKVIHSEDFDWEHCLLICGREFFVTVSMTWIIFADKSIFRHLDLIQPM